MMPPTVGGVDLSYHGDRGLEPGLVDLAVNVRAGTPPPWLRERLADVDLAAYPDQSVARRAVAARHHRDPAGVLLTAGAAEAFALLARVLRPRRAVVIHPQFTEPEAALRAAGHPVQRVVLAEPFTLDPALIPDTADLVAIGNPTNPTSVLHPADRLRALIRPGRTLIVDEAFADCVPGEPDSLAGGPAAPGVVVIRSLTKTWGLAGLRAGYVLAEPDLVKRMRAAQQPWPVGTAALAACAACSRPDAIREAHAWAASLTATRTHLAESLTRLPGVHVVPGARASFLLVRLDAPAPWIPLRGKGFAVRRGDTFPGLGPHWIRVAVRDTDTTDRFTTALQEVLT